MALTAKKLAVAMRLIVEETDTLDASQLAIVTRLGGVADAFITLLIPTAPEPIQDEVKVRFASYLHDAPTGARGDFYGNAWRNSGAGALATRWVVRRTGDPHASTNAVGGLTADQVQALIDSAIADLPET